MIAAAWIVLQRVPKGAWLVMLLGLSLAAGATHVYHAGERHVARAVRAATTNAAIIRLDSSKAHLERVIARAAESRPATVSTGHRRQQLRQAVSIVDSRTLTIEGKVDTVPTAIVELLQADDAKIRADSVHQAATDAIPPAIAVTEFAHASVDSALVQQVVAGDAADGPHSHQVAIALAVIGTLGVVWGVLHR